MLKLEKIISKIFVFSLWIIISYFIFCFLDRLYSDPINNKIQYVFISDKDGNKRQIASPFQNRKIEIKAGERIVIGINRINYKPIHVVNERIIKYHNEIETVLLQNKRTYSKPEAVMLEIYYDIPINSEPSCGNEVYTRIYISVMYNLLTYISPIIEDLRNEINICIVR